MTTQPVYTTQPIIVPYNTSQSVYNTIQPNYETTPPIYTTQPRMNTQSIQPTIYETTSPTYSFPPNTTQV